MLMDLDNETNVSESVSSMEIKLTYLLEDVILNGVYSASRTAAMDIFEWDEPEAGSVNRTISDLGARVLESEIGDVESVLSFPVDLLRTGEPRLTVRSSSANVVSKADNGALKTLPYGPEDLTIPAGTDPIVPIPFRVVLDDRQVSVDELAFPEIIIAASCTEVIPVEIESISFKTADLLAETCHLYQNYPNPFNPETDISFTVPQEAWVTVTAQNRLGRGGCDPGG
jgi:hypothetical protein